MLNQRGLGPRMTKLILWCVKISSFSFMINGYLTEPFNIEKGLRQGDPISSFIFSIAGEALAFIIHKEKLKGVIEGLRVGIYNFKLTLLQYANDTLIFLPHNVKNILNIKIIL